MRCKLKNPHLLRHQAPALQIIATNLLFKLIIRDLFSLRGNKTCTRIKFVVFAWGGFEGAFKPNCFKFLEYILKP